MSRNEHHPTTCKSVAESLPWLLNGTLGKAEVASVVAHVRDCSGCRREIREAVETAELMTAHLPTMVLAEHALGLPTEWPVEAIDAHLAICSSCRGELALVQMDTGLDEDGESAEPARVLSFPAVANDTPGRSVASSDWTRWAAAAGLIAALGGSWIVGGLDSASEGPTQLAQHELPPVEKPVSVEMVFSDGFESGDLEQWTVHDDAG